MAMLLVGYVFDCDALAFLSTTEFSILGDVKRRSNFFISLCSLVGLDSIELCFRIDVHFNREKIIEVASPLFVYMWVLHTVVPNRLH